MTPIHEGTLEERARNAIQMLRDPHPSLRNISNTIRQLLAEIIEGLLKRVETTDSWER